MSRRTEAAAEKAAQAASEAARVLQARGQQVKAESQQPEQPKDDEAEAGLSSERIQQLRNANPRNRIIEELQEADMTRRGVKAQEPEKKSESREPPPPETPEPLAEKPAEALAETPAPSEAPVEPAKTVRVKVDGEEFDVPAEDVEAAGGVTPYRIQRAAENRLKKANEALAEVKRVAADIAAHKPPEQPAAPKESDAQFIASKVDTIRFGTPEESAAALQEILTRATKQPDQNTLIEHAVNRIKHDQAVTEFDREFQDLVADPLVLSWIVAERNRRLAQEKSPVVDWPKFYRTIGTEIRNRIGRPSQPGTVSALASGTPSQSSDKEARKASIVNPPGSSTRAELPKEEKPQTREELINEMKKSRGFPIA